MRTHGLSLLRTVAVAMLLAGCSSSNGGGGGGGSSLATIRGLVTDAIGVALGGVTIRSGATTTNSLADGSYSLAVTPGANLRISASRAGSVETFEMVSLTAGQTLPLDFSVRAIGQTTALTGMLTTPATVTDPRGTELMLGANTLVDSNGAPVDTATLEVSTALASDLNYTSTFPGLFIGTTAGVDAPIESFGFVTIELTSTAGLAVNLAPGATAGLAIPVAPGADPGTATIDLWSLDETTGKWVSEGQATRDASGSPVVYRAQVSHFSTYNLDQPINSSLPFTITVEDSNHVVVGGASVVIASTNQTGGGMWEGRAVTATNGTVHFPIVPQGTVTVNAAKGAQVGLGYSYTVTGGVATMTITMFTGVTRTFTVVYLAGGVETPVPNLAVAVLQSSSQSPTGGGLMASGITNANGEVTLGLQEGHTTYLCNAGTTIGGIAYTFVNNQFTSAAAIPDKWVLTP